MALLCTLTCISDSFDTVNYSVVSLFAIALTLVFDSISFQERYLYLSNLAFLLTMVSTTMEVKGWCNIAFWAQLLKANNVLS